MAEVEILTEQLTHLGKLSNQYGSGRVCEQMVQLLNREANQLLHGTYSEKTGRALLSAVAKATRTVGFMSSDVGRHALAQGYFIQALDLAMRAGDRSQGADILQEASRLTVRIGENAPPGQDTTRHGRQAAKLHAVEARGFALLGDARETRLAVAATQRYYETVTPEDAAGFYHINGFGHDLARCLSGIGDTEQAITMSTTALNGTEPWMVLSLCLVQTDLALAHLHGRDLEQSAAFGRDALRSATTFSSTITVERLRTLHRQVRPLRSTSPHLRDLDDRLTTFLTHPTRRQPNDTSLWRAAVTTQETAGEGTREVPTETTLDDAGR